MSDNDLETLLKDDPKPEPKSEAQPDPRPEPKDPEPGDRREPVPEPEPAAKEADQTGDGAEEPAKDVPPASKDSRDAGVVPLEALLNEREKRQSADRAREALETQLREQQETAKRPDPAEDPEGAMAFDRDQWRQEMIDMRVNQSYEIASATISDFDDVMADWRDACAKDPTLYDRAVQQPSPAKWAYDHLKAQKVAAEVGNDPVAYREKLREELKAEILAEREARKADTQETQETRSDLPETLAGEPSTTKRSSTFTGPTPLDDLVKIEGLRNTTP